LGSGTCSICSRLTTHRSLCKDLFKRSEMAVVAN
jgi:hypothetical protein